MKNKVLIIFKYHRNWNINVINKFSNYYDTDHLYISDYKDKNFLETIQTINSLIKEKDIKIVVFDVDYFKFINLFFIEKINSEIKLLWTGDDFELHEMNAITASACDLVLSHCPLSVLKYREKGYEAYNLQGENGKINKHENKKDIDVLFFGHLTKDRKDILDYISSSGISLKNVGHEDHVIGLPSEELYKLIGRSNIVLNLSKSRTTSVSNYGSEKIYRFYYQFKGRIILSGLNGSVCVSEYSPGQELLFEQDEVPSFRTKEECVNVLKKLLDDENLLLKYKNKFVLKVQNICEDRKNFESIFRAIEKSNFKRNKLTKIPYWYLRLSAKQIILRNARLSNFIKTLFQFRAIFSVIKRSNIFVKFLIIFETILNILWYSFTLTLKSKK